VCVCIKDMSLPFLA